MGYGYKKTTGWSIVFKIIFILIVYIAGIFTGDWWAVKYHDTRVRVSDFINPDKEFNNVTSDTIVPVFPQDTSKNESFSENKSLLLYVPFNEKNGVKYIKIKVNNMEFDAIYDTGCGFPISFTPKAYYKMVGAGIIEEDKFTHQSTGVIADGTHVDEYHFIIPNIIIGDLVFNNQSVSVSSTGDEILVGNPLWSNYKSYTIDNENRRLVFQK